MKIKTSELEGAALDWAVAKGAGWNVYTRNGRVYQADVMGTVDTPAFPFSPSRRWDMVGPLIERFQIMTKSSASGTWIALIPVPKKDGYLDWIKTSGQSPLIAACRAIVAAKLGDEVEVPEELA